MNLLYDNLSNQISLKRYYANYKHNKTEINLSEYFEK